MDYSFEDYGNSESNIQETENTNNVEHFKTFSFFAVFFCLVACVAYVAYDELIAKLPIPVCEDEHSNIIKDMKYWMRAEVAKSVYQLQHMRATRQTTGFAERREFAKNFASAVAGASVVDSSSTWDGWYPKRYFVIISIPSKAHSPVTALQPTTDVGHCWPMKGNRGHLLIQLAADTFVEAFTIEHIPNNSHLVGFASEAPNAFKVYGVDMNMDEDNRHFFGSYSYDINGPYFQSFPVRNLANRSFWLIDLEIWSNHGHRRTTCLYRFLVHGRINDEHCNCG